MHGTFVQYRIIFGYFEFVVSMKLALVSSITRRILVVWIHMLRFYVLSLEGGTPATAEVLSSKNGAPGQSHQDPQEMVSTNGGAGKNSVSKSARITLKVETSVEGLMPLATPDRGEEAQTESAGVGAPSDRSVTFTQETLSAPPDRVCWCGRPV